MITKFKIFEEVDWDSIETGADDSWELGSYVLVSLEDVNEPILHGLPLTDTAPARVIKWRDDENFPFMVMFSNGRDFGATKDEILRYLTPEEIEQYKIDLESDKYNL
jgi:hypothetical protein